MAAPFSSFGLKNEFLWGIPDAVGSVTNVIFLILVLSIDVLLETSILSFQLAFK